MKTEEPKLDKSKWGPGPWQTEPDRMEFEHKGFPCLLRRADVAGAWCGYVAVPPGHLAYEQSYNKLDLDVHGGLTYAEHCLGPICHVPKAGESDNVWWLGFDCAHAGDGMPAMLKFLTSKDSWIQEGYKDIAYAKRQTIHLAEQLAAMK